jgi:hypothetical protein
VSGGFVDSEHLGSPPCSRWILGAHATGHNLPSGAFVRSQSVSQTTSWSRVGRLSRVSRDTELGRGYD